MQIPEKISEKVLTENKYRKVFEMTYKLSSWKEKSFIITGHNNTETSATMIIPITKDWEILYLREFRYWPEKFIINFPIWMQENYLSEEENCRKELLEETWYNYESIEFIGETIIENYSKWQIRYFLATWCEKNQEIWLEEWEIIEVHKTSIDNFSKMITDWDVQCSFSISWFFLALNKLKCL